MRYAGETQTSTGTEIKPFCGICAKTPGWEDRKNSHTEKDHDDYLEIIGEK